MYRSYLNSYKLSFKVFLFSNEKNITPTIIEIYPSALYINSSDIIWEDNNKEVIYKGIQYDVYKIKNQKGKVFIYLIPDEKEQELKMKFAQLYNENDSNKDSKSLNLLTQFLSLKYLNADSLIILKQTYKFLKHKTEYVLKIKSIIFLTKKPPPNSFI